MASDDGIAQAVEQRALGLPFLRAHAAQGLHQFADRALLAKCGNAHGLQGSFIAGGGDLRQEVGLKGGDVGHANSGEKDPGGRMSPRRSARMEFDLGLGRLIHQSLEGNGLMDGEVAQHLTVDRDARTREPGDKSAVGEAMLAHGGVDALDPQSAEVTLALLAANIVVLQRLIDRGIGRGDVVLAAAGKALGLLQNLVAAGAAGYGTGERDMA